MNIERRVVAIYERVSSEEQREQETIKTQSEVIDRWLVTQSDITVYERYRDDGVSGTIPFRQRKEGRRLAEAAMRGRFTEIVVTRPNRLGRNEIDLLQFYALMQGLGIKLTGISEAIGDEFMFGINAIVSGADRRRLLALSAEGMERAAREGRFCGGIIPLGYVKVGKKKDARLAPSDIVIWGEWTEAELMRQIYGWLVAGWSCRRIADHLNALGVPTAYDKDGRLVKERGGVRKQRTQGQWRPSRIRNMVVNPVYKGEYHYGRRSKKAGREIIASAVPALVSAAVWDAAQAALREHNIMPKSTHRPNLLRSVIRCGGCGRNYSGAWGRGELRYRCNGSFAYRGLNGTKCDAKSLRGDQMHEIVWGDVERFLRAPGDLIEELKTERHETGASAQLEAERHVVESALTGIPQRRDRILDAYSRQRIDDDEFDRAMDAIVEEEKALRNRLAELTPDTKAEEPPDIDLLAELVRRLDDGLDDMIKLDVIRALVKEIVVHSERVGDGPWKRATVHIVYRFSAVEETSTGTGSWPSPA